MQNKSSKILIIGDPHFGVRSNNEKYLEVFYNYFTKDILKIIQEHKIQDVRILGDYFNDRNTINLKTLNIGMEVFKVFLNKIPNVKFSLLLGNHDIYYNTTLEVNSLEVLSLFPNVRIIKDVEIETICNKKIVSIPWLIQNTQVCNKFFEILQNNEKYDVLFCHLELGEFLSNYDNSQKYFIKKKDLKKFSKVFSGHIHKKIFEDNIYYVGTPYQLYWSDLNLEKGVHIYDIENDKIEFIVNSTSPKHIIIFLSKIKNNVQKYQKEIYQNIIKFVIDEDIEEKDIISILNSIEQMNPFKIDIENILNNNQIYENIDENNEIKNIQEIKNKNPLDFLIEYIQKLDIKQEKISKEIIIETIKQEYYNNLNSKSK
ncbi:MAG: metallophosphoesterase [Candidatus Dojkabacteria bacterium]|nr:metallophosphoesterase [Candidatus Dojkabacteria bacterium]